MTDELRERLARSVEGALDAGFDSWLSRWSSPAGVYDDAPDPPSRHKTAPEHIVAAILAEIDAAGYVVVPVGKIAETLAKRQQDQEP